MGPAKMIADAPMSESIARSDAINDLRLRPARVDISLVADAQLSRKMFVPNGVTVMKKTLGLFLLIVLIVLTYSGEQAHSDFVTGYCTPVGCLCYPDSNGGYCDAASHTEHGECAPQGTPGCKTPQNKAICTGIRRAACFQGPSLGNCSKTIDRTCIS